MSPSPDTMLQRSAGLAIDRTTNRSGDELRLVPAVHVNVRGRRWSSIERQLPLLILALLVPTVITLVVCVHTGVRSDLRDAASDRMQANANEVAALFETGSTRTLGYLQNTGENERLVSWTVHPDPTQDKGARDALMPYLRRHTGEVEVWSLEGQLLLRINSPVAEGETAPALLDTKWPMPEKVGHQLLQLVDALPVHAMVVDIRSRDKVTKAVSPPVGRLVLRRNFTGGQGAELLGRLLGTHAALRLGNRDGSLWTDIDHQVQPPEVDPLDPSQHVFTNANGVLRAGAGFVLKDTPWVLWVECDAGQWLAPADHLLLIMLLVGSGLLVAGGFAAWGISRRITRPLREATEAAEAIAAGDYGRRLLLRRHDEVGRLTHAFNTMAAEVEDARAQQDALVARRTADLSRALRQLRDAQDDLVRQEKLALMGQLAGSVGHELRNPLGVMTNAIYYLDMVLEQSSPEVRDYLGILRRQVSLSEKIITDLLDFTRHRPPSAGPLDLGHVAAEQLDRLGPLRVQVDNRIPADLPKAWADGVQVGQIVFNLLTNAVQAMESKPEGTLSLQAHVQDGRIRLEVSDTGPGVSEEMRERVFEPLFTTRARGIGLGLSVSRRLAEGNGGSLTLAPRNGACGATFVLELPTGERGSG